MKKLAGLFVLSALLMTGCAGGAKSEDTPSTNIPAVPHLVGMNGAEARDALHQVILSYDFYLNGKPAQIIGNDLGKYRVAATNPAEGVHPPFGTVTEVDLVRDPAVPDTPTPSSKPSSANVATPQFTGSAPR